MEELNSKMSEMSEMKIRKKLPKKNKINLICSICKKSITNKLCFCDKLDYYNENIVSIIKIQNFHRFNRVSVIEDNIINDIIIMNIKKYNNLHNKLFMKCKKVLNMYPPAKNEYKFIYGNLIQMCVIEFLDNIFYKCIDLDTLCKYGSQYKVDCRLNITSLVSDPAHMKGIL